MLIEVMKSKIHRIKVTQTELDYVGSITLDKDLVEKANLVAGEKVQILNINTGARFETYVIVDETNSGNVCLNGPAARLAEVGDIIIVISYALMTPEEAKNFSPTIIFPENE